MNHDERPADWKPEIVIRNNGVTAEERYLQGLCDRSFLSLWSYAGLFRNQKADGKGDGKERCDLLVVCGDNILIFSDKGCAFPDTGEVKLDWSRWFKRSIQKSAEQAWGAGRWLMQHPDRIFLDRACQQKFPIDLPTPDRMTIHHIVAAHNISARCKANFRGSSGTLIFNSAIVGEAHFSGDSVTPFSIGWMDLGRPFVHVLDDESLDILLTTCDTITDFVQYLGWKEGFLKSGVERGVAIAHCGEEDLLANYLLSLNGGKHGFDLPAEPINQVFIDEGDWRMFLGSAQRAAQLEADRDSYFWDYIIEKFCKNILGGTSYDKSTALIAERERAIRLLARERRLSRRVLARELIALQRKNPLNFRAVKVSIPEGGIGTYFCFLLMPRYPGIPTETYRQVRGQHLEALLRVTKLVYPDALDIVGLATEAGMDHTYRSEDVVYLDTRNWNAEEQENARQLQRELNLLTNVKMGFSRDFAYPVDLPSEGPALALGDNPRNKPCPCGSGKKYKKCHGEPE